VCVGPVRVALVRGAQCQSDPDRAVLAAAIHQKGEFVADPVGLHGVEQRARSVERPPVDGHDDVALAPASCGAQTCGCRGTAGDHSTHQSTPWLRAGRGEHLDAEPRPGRRGRRFEKLAQHLFICPPSAAQHAALAAFTPESLTVLEARRAEFERRRNFLVPALEATGLRVLVRPEGAFYVYADCSALSADARQFARDLLEREAVAATPGADFGANRTQQFLRFAYTRALPELEDGARRLARFCAGATPREPRAPVDPAPSA